MADNSDLSADIESKNYDKVLNVLNDIQITTPDGKELALITDTFLKLYDKEDDITSKIAVKCLNLLKGSCFRGGAYQDKIIGTDKFLASVEIIMTNNKIKDFVQLYCLQLLANLCVQNKPNQELVMKNFQARLLQNIENNNQFCNVSTMIIYNAHISKAKTDLDSKLLLEAFIRNIAKNLSENSEIPEFVCIFVEHLITVAEGVMVENYPSLNAENKIVLLDFLTEFIKQENCRSALNPDFLSLLILEFKQKTDTILKTIENYVDQINPQEVFSLLKFVSEACCFEPYSSQLKEDASVFLNIGCLLRTVQAAGTKSDNIFTPIQKIDEIIQVKKPNSDSNIERELSYSLKSMLVKTLANLSHKNKKNQDLAREMEIMTTVLECTNLDARNPMIKEWSILAIRNLCENNMDNQRFIDSLTKVDDAENSLVTEHTDEGTIRIKENTQQ